jgi:aromatic-L-amino-acid decarboxylase
MTSEEFRLYGHQAIEWVATYLENSGRYPVLPNVKPGELTDALPGSGPEHAEPMKVILADFRHLIVPAMTHWNHPGFLAYFANSATGEGILGNPSPPRLTATRHVVEDSPASPNWSR